MHIRKRSNTAASSHGIAQLAVPVKIPANRLLALA
jgi:hypothetical protein